MAIKFFKKINKNNGYALLFTIVVVSIMIAMASGISNSISKQIILSSTARDSQVAFYEADTAAECALYANSKGGGFVITTSMGSQFPCGLDDTNSQVVLNVAETFSGSQIYNFTPPSSQKGTCFRFTMDESGGPTDTTADAYGYNICDTANKRSVERGIELIFY